MASRTSTCHEVRNLRTDLFDLSCMIVVVCFSADIDRLTAPSSSYFDDVAFYCFVQVRSLFDCVVFLIS